MYQDIFNNKNYYCSLHDMDLKIAQDIKAQGCTYCNDGFLHQSNYQRKPRGAPLDIDPKYFIRFSFCCNQEGCRKRMTTPSLRFLSQKVYASLVIVLIFLLPGNVNDQIGTLNEYYPSELSLAEETVLRWRDYWKNKFPLSIFYKQRIAVFQLDISLIPSSLLNHFKSPLTHQLFQLLLHLSPMSVSPN